MTDKLKIVLDLVRKGAITDEQAQELLKTEKEYIYSYQPITYPYWSTLTYPYGPYYPTVTTGTFTYCNNNSGNYALTSDWQPYEANS